MMSRFSPWPVLVLAAIAACGDQPEPTEFTAIEHQPLASGKVGNGTVKGGGVDDSNNQGSASATSFPPFDADAGSSWSRPSTHGYRLGAPCDPGGFCFNGDLVAASFGTLPHPDGTPPPAGDQFGIISTADFICKAGFSNCLQGPGQHDSTIVVTSTAVQTPTFTVPVGDFRLEFRWAFLTNALDLDNFARVQLIDATAGTVDLVNLTGGDIGDPGHPAARAGGCGEQIIGNDATGSFNEVYDLCTDWQTFSMSVADRAGHSVRLLFEVTEVGSDNRATTFAFEDVDLVAAPTAPEGTLEQVQAPDEPDGSYAWSIAAGCTIAGGTATAQTVSFSCADDGSYDLYLVTTPAFGPVRSDTSAVSITNVAPAVGSIALPGQITPSTPFTATASFTDPGTGDTHTGAWNWGDGSPPQPATVFSGNTFSNSHTYAEPGNYTITLTVTDDDGGSDEAEATASVQETTVAASIDIRPATSSNVINLTLLPIIPVALWGRPGFDVTEVAVSSLRFGPGGAPPLLGGALRIDLNHDGRKDLLASFRTKRSGIQVGQTSACLTGTIAGQPFQGCDAITVVAGP